MSIEVTKEQASASLRAALAAWQQIAACGHQVQAAVIIGDAERANACRIVAHDLLDAMLDRHVEVAHHARQAAERR